MKFGWTADDSGLADRGVAMRDGDWAHGGDLIVSYRSVDGKPATDDEPRATLDVGTIRRDGSVEGNASREDACEYASYNRQGLIRHDAPPDPGSMCSGDQSGCSGADAQTIW